MNKVFNEEKHANKMIEESKFLFNKVNGYELGILAKYYFNNDKFNRPKVRQSLIDFCKEYDKNFDEVIKRKMITMAVEIGKKYDYINLEDIGITENELEIIRKLNNIKYEKVVFVLLILSKINNQTNKIKFNSIHKKDENKDVKYEDRFFVGNKHSEIINMAKLNIKVDERNEIFKKLEEKKFILITKKCNIQILIVDDLDNKNIITVNMLDDFIYEYLKYKGEYIDYCENCGKPIRKNSNTIKYCRQCAREIWYEKHKEIARNGMRKKRNVD